MSDRLVDKIREMSKKYTEGHLKNPNHSEYLLIENAALLGAALTLRELQQDVRDARNAIEEDKDYLVDLINLKPDIVQ